MPSKNTYIKMAIAKSSGKMSLDRLDREVLKKISISPSELKRIRKKMKEEAKK